ncbi:MULTISPECIES: hypothetical protein [unclassified Mesorhizobium]|uniref:hypothetical protein n=1 Tax=unclassified Mesorhizobium TaxID=325217 RepID=UPI0033378C3B
MAPVVPPDPQSAADYDDRTTAAVKSVLLEIGQILGSFKGAAIALSGQRGAVADDERTGEVWREWGDDCQALLSSHFVNHLA